MDTPRNSIVVITNLNGQIHAMGFKCDEITDPEKRRRALYLLERMAREQLARFELEMKV